MKRWCMAILAMAAAAAMAGCRAGLGNLFDVY